jgi:formiminoglutamase
MSNSLASAYQAPEQQAWHGLRQSSALEYYHQVVQLMDLRSPTALKANSLNIGLLGFCCDQGVIRNLGRPGAKEGPNAFRHALANLPIHFNQSVQVYDCGNIVCLDDDLETAQAHLAQAVALLRQLNLHPVLIGGGHEMAFGHYQGLVKNGMPDNFGIINFDAHFDLRPLLPEHRGSSGTPFLQIAQDCKKQQAPFRYSCVGIQPYANISSLFEQAKALDVRYRLAEDVILGGLDANLEFLKDALAHIDNLYLTICLDVFNVAYAPGVSAPQATGLSPWDVIPLLRYLVRSKKIISLDIAELSPPNDRRHQTEKLAAWLVSDYIHGVGV